MGALVGAVAIFIFFAIVAPPFRSPEALATVLYASSTIGIMAVAVGLLMIGGEFDLSAGVAVTTSALAASMLSYNLHLNLWVGAALALCVSLAVGFFNGYLVMKTKIPSFLITLCFVPDAHRYQPGRDQARHRAGRLLERGRHGRASTRPRRSSRPPSTSSASRSGSRCSGGCCSRSSPPTCCSRPGSATGSSRSAAIWRARGPSVCR